MKIVLGSVRKMEIRPEWQLNEAGYRLLNGSGNEPEKAARKRPRAGKGSRKRGAAGPSPAREEIYVCRARRDLVLSIRQSVQIPAVLNLAWDDVFAGHTGDGAAQVWRQEVMNRPFPPAHASADSFLLDVLRERRPFLGKLGVEGSGDVAHGVPGPLISLEEHLLGVLSKESAGMVLAAGSIEYILTL